MKFTMPPLGHSGDPFGDDQRVEVDITERPAAPGSFAFAPESSFIPPVATAPAQPDRFAGLGSNAGSATKSAPADFKFAELRKEDHFAGFSATTGSAAAREYDFPGFKFARPERNDSLFAALGPESEPDAPFAKAAAAEFHKFTMFTKVEEQDDGNVMVWGIATLEQPDLDGETCHYETAKKAYQDWSVAAVSRTSAAGQQISLGPIRYQHSTEPAGKAVKLDYNDATKEIWLGSIPINDDVQRQLQEGYLTGYSQGGSYAWRKCANCGKSLSLQQGNNYCPNCKGQVPVLFGLKRLSEVSYVDSPCTGKGFEYVKSDGTRKFVNFSKRAAAGISGADGVRITDTVRIYQGRGAGFSIWKSTAEVNGLKRTVLHWPDGVLAL